MACIFTAQFLHPSFYSSDVKTPGPGTSLCGSHPVVLAGHPYGQEDTRGRTGVASVLAPPLKRYMKQPDSYE